MNPALIKNELEFKLNKAYGDYKAAAVVVTKDEKKYFGVSVNIGKEIGYTSAITNAVCTAVSNGEREFKCVYVLFEELSELCWDNMLDLETKGLLKEFKVNEVRVFKSKSAYQIMRIQ